MVTQKQNDTLTNENIMDKAIQTYISVLKAEIAHLKTLLEPTEDKRLTGIPDTIVTLQRRVKELENG